MINERVPLSFDNTEIAFRYRSDKELKMAQLLFRSMSSPTITAIGIQATQIALKLKIPISNLVRKTIFRQFCGGETMQEAARTANKIAPFGVDVILDYGVEGMHNEAAFDAAVPEFIKAIHYAAQHPDIPFISLKLTGFARFDLLAKIHNKQPLSSPEEMEWKKVQERILRICEEAAANKVMVLIDAEESWIQQPVDDLTDLMMEKFNKEGVFVYNTYQLYRHDRLAFLKTSLEKAKSKGYLLGAKLVRGAYMEKERARAEELNYPSPIQPNKEACDRDYDAAVAYCLEEINHLYLFIGTHNELSCRKAAEILEQKKIDKNSPRIFFSQLYGMSDNISFNLAHAGYRVAKYLPYGPVKDVMPYLMRRAQENTSIAGQTSRELLLIKKEIARRKL